MSKMKKMLIRRVSFRLQPIIRSNEKKKMISSNAPLEPNIKTAKVTNPPNRKSTMFFDRNELKKSNTAGNVREFASPML